MMFISKFNRLLKSKALWGVIIGVIAVSFVFWGTSTGGVSEAENAALAGRLGGKKISREEFRRAYFDTYLSMSLMMGRPLNIDRKTDGALKKMTWGKMAALDKAGQLGIIVGDQEVAGEIQKQPFFMENNVFNPQRFEAFVQQWLPTLNATVAQFEESVRNELIRDRLRRVLATAVWIAPAELTQIFGQLYDKFTISFVGLSAEEIGRTLVVTPDDVEKYFEENKESFTLPRRMRVKYMAFPIIDYLDMAEVSETDIEDYYYDNTIKFTTYDTNNVPNTAPFEEVAEEIRLEIAMSRAKSEAGDAAAEVETLLAPDRQGRAPSFEQGAEAVGLAVHTTAAFTAAEVIPGLDLDLTATKAAFELRNTPDEYFSRPLTGKEAVYLLAFESVEEPRVPAFEEVREEAVEAAKESAAFDELHKQAGEIAKAVETALDAGSTFEEALAPFNLEIKTTKPFSASSAAETETDDIKSILRYVMPLGKGEFAGIIPTPGGVFIAYVKDRAPADQAMFDSMRMDLAEFVKKRRADILFAEWQKNMLQPGNFENLLDAGTASDDEEFQDESDDDYGGPDEDS